MKHVFMIHSNTVLLSALGAIQYEKIPHQAILFLYSRNFSSPLLDKDIAKADVSDLYYLSHKNGFQFKIYEHKLLIRTADLLVDNLIGEDFIIYVPHASVPLFQVFITNKYCRGTNFLQEGAFSFFGKPIKRIKLGIENLFFSNKRMWFRITWDIPKGRKKSVNLNKTYSCDKEYFKPLCDAENILIKWPSYHGNKVNYEKGTNFFLFESVVEQNFMNINDYLLCCKTLLKESEVKKCYIKFHPAQQKKNKELILKLFDGIQYEILDNDIPFELILSSNKELNLFGFSTSLLKYGKDLGHHITCRLNLLINASEAFDKYVSQSTYKDWVATL